ncbi:hypothetical protein DFH09DRAFT_1073329 [Mycena vulgaris]|nr:hypothetical protein DFH09DRAFT_1073329 [Mycena vulgaris]
MELSEKKLEPSWRSQDEHRAEIQFQGIKGGRSVIPSLSVPASSTRETPPIWKCYWAAGFPKKPLPDISRRQRQDEWWGLLQCAARTHSKAPLVQWLPANYTAGKTWGMYTLHALQACGEHVPRQLHGMCSGITDSTKPSTGNDSRAECLFVVFAQVRLVAAALCVPEIGPANSSMGQEWEKLTLDICATAWLKNRLHELREELDAGLRNQNSSDHSASQTAIG